MTQLQSTDDIKKGLFAFGAVALFIAAYYPALQLIVSIWYSSEEYNHAFITLPVIGYMLWKKFPNLSNDNPRYAFTGVVLIAISTSIYYFALLMQVNSIIFLCMFITIIGSIIYLWGISSIKEILTPLLLFVILIPIPDQLYIKLTFPLQLKVSQASEVLIRLLGIPILREGNIMSIPEKSFEVVEACSGLRSMITLITLSIVIGFFMLRRMFPKIVLILSSVPIAVFINIIRVSVMIIAFHFFRLDLTQGTLHTAIGLLVFVLAFATLIGVQRLTEIWDNR